MNIIFRTFLLSICCGLGLSFSYSWPEQDNCSGDDFAFVESQGLVVGKRARKGGDEVSFIYRYFDDEVEGLGAWKQTIPFQPVQVNFDLPLSRSAHSRRLLPDNRKILSSPEDRGFFYYDELGTKRYRSGKFFLGDEGDLRERPDENESVTVNDPRVRKIFRGQIKRLHGYRFAGVYDDHYYLDDRAKVEIKCPYSCGQIKQFIWSDEAEHIADISSVSPFSEAVLRFHMGRKAEFKLGFPANDLRGINSWNDNGVHYVSIIIDVAKGVRVITYDSNGQNKKEEISNYEELYPNNNFFDDVIYTKNNGDIKSLHSIDKYSIRHLFYRGPSFDLIDVHDSGKYFILLEKDRFLIVSRGGAIIDDWSASNCNGSIEEF